MADTKISALTAVTDLLDTDEFVLARAGASKKIAATRLQPAIVTAFPGSPSNNDEVYLRVGTGSADSDVLWHMKYDSSITDSYKWRFLGGAALVATQVAVGTTSSATYVELNSGAPQVTLPGIGIYEFSHGFDATVPGGATFGIANVKTNGSTPANDDESAQLKPIGNDALAAVARIFQRTVSSVATNALAVQVYRTTGTSTNFHRRWLVVRPVRLG